MEVIFSFLLNTYIFKLLFKPWEVTVHDTSFRATFHNCYLCTTVRSQFHIRLVIVIHRSDFLPSFVSHRYLIVAAMRKKLPNFYYASLPFSSREGAGTNANIYDASVSLKIDEVFCGKVSLMLLVCVSRSLFRGYIAFLSPENTDCAISRSSREDARNKWMLLDLIYRRVQ